MKRGGDCLRLGKSPRIRQGGAPLLNTLQSNKGTKRLTTRRSIFTARVRSSLRGSVFYFLHFIFFLVPRGSVAGGRGILFRCKLFECCGSLRGFMQELPWPPPVGWVVGGLLYDRKTL